MGPRQWTYGQRSRSNPRSRSGSLLRPHVEDFNFKPRIDSAEGCAVPGHIHRRPGTHGRAHPRCTRAPVDASRGLRARSLRPPRQVGLRDRPQSGCPERGGGLRDDHVLSLRSALIVVTRVGRSASVSDHCSRRVLPSGAPLFPHESRRSVATGAAGAARMRATWRLTARAAALTLWALVLGAG
jgi:hypothetical protein